MSRELRAALVAGLLAGGLFLGVFGVGARYLPGFELFFMFLPALPILGIGMSDASRKTHACVLAAFAVVALVAGPAAALLLLFFLALPAWYLATQSLRRGAGGTWRPIGLILLDLTVYAIATAALMTLYYAKEPGGLPGMLGAHISQALAELGDEYRLPDEAARHLAFMVFSISLWLWALMLYAHGWIAGRVLRYAGMQLRPDFRLEVFAMPSWALALAAIAALAALIGSESMAFAGKVALTSLLLPYFLLGCALLHETAKTWKNPGVVLFMVYFLVFILGWPALFICALGLRHQIKCLSDGRDSTKT